MGPKPRDWPELHGGGCEVLRAGKSLVLMTKKEEKAVGVSICWEVLLCRRKMWNLPVSRAKKNGNSQEVLVLLSGL